MHDRNESVTLGEFLNREDSLKLIELLQQEIRVRSKSVRTLREFQTRSKHIEITMATLA